MSEVGLHRLVEEFVDRMRGRKYVFIGGIAVMAHGIPHRTLDMDIIAKERTDFEAACLSIQGIEFAEVKPATRFAPGFAKWRGHGFGGDVRLKKLWFRAQVRGRTIEQKVTPDEEFWRDIKLQGAEIFGVGIPVPKPADLAVLKAASSVAPCRSPLKAPHDREHALELMRRFSISREELGARARAMGCLKPVERFLASL